MKPKQSKDKYRDHANINPIIIEIDEQQNQDNDDLIQKMVKGNYSGGFKNNSVTKSKIIDDAPLKNSLYRPQSQGKYNSSKINVAQQMGVGSNKAVNQSYLNTNSNQQKQSYSLSQLQQRVSQLREDRQTKNSSLLYQVPEKSNHYNISNNPSRFQEAIHVQSSLDVISLENIQSKLQAHRKRMRPIQEQYSSKIGKPIPLDRYGYIQTNVDVDKLHSKMTNKDQESNLYQLAKKKIQYEPEQAELQELWELKKKNNPKLAEYDTKYQQYLLQKDAKNIIGYTIRDKLFKWDKYVQPEHKKSKPKLRNKVHRESLSPKKHETSQEKINSFSKDNTTEKYGPDGLMSIRDIKDVIATRDDKFIASYIFAELDMNKVGIISKEQLHQYIITQQHILRGYSIDVKWLYTDLDNYETKRKGMLTKGELAVFLVSLEKLDHPKLTLTNTSNFLEKQQTLKKSQLNFSNSRSPITSHFNKQIFEKLFNALDFNDDKIIKRQQYIQNIYIDADCIKLLDKEVIRIQPIQKSITYRQIIACILDDYRKQKNQKLKKSKQYLTFERFCEYFKVSQSIDLKRIDQNSLKKYSQNSTQFQIYDIPEQYLVILKDIFNTLPRIYQNYIVSVDFVQTALRDPQILAIYDQLCRIESIETRLPIETLGTCLQRIQKQSDQYSNWQGMKMYFSRRGRPLQWDYALIMKKKQLRNQKLNQSKRFTLSQQKLRNLDGQFELEDRLRSKNKNKTSKLPNRYTIPQPFDITDMQQKVPNKMIAKGEEQFNQFKQEYQQFKAKPVNQEILESKPDLIMGKILKKKDEKSVQKQYYKYENYENDRIERALKKAQEKYQQQQKVKQVKEKTQVKAMNIGVDLTKKYQDVIKEQQKKNKEVQRKKYKETHPENISENLYPKNPTQEKSKKLDKAKKKLEKAEQITKRKNQLLEQQKNRMKQKNDGVKKTSDEAKKRDEQEKKKRDQMAIDKYDFKPKIKKNKITEEQKQANQKNKIQRGQKQREKEQAVMRARQQQRKKILEQQTKVGTLDISNLAAQQILQRIDQVDLADLMLDPESKIEYKQQFPNKNKTRKQIKEREQGLAGRERAKMQKQEKKMIEQKRKLKQKIQKDRTSVDKKSNSGEFSRVSERGQKGKIDTQFHRSRALRRYRAIMQGADPLSEFDKYSTDNNQNLNN